MTFPSTDAAAGIAAHAVYSPLAPSLAGSGAGMPLTGHALRRRADTALRLAARAWWLVAVAGQLFFALYVASFYGGAVLQGHLARWNKVLPHGFVPGEPMGNAAVGAHLFLAVLIILGGAIQFIPQIRSRAPAFHRWNGRVYIVSAFAISLIGLYMVWTRGAVGGLAQHVAISINGVLIMLCAALALRHAMARQFAIHRRWALRLFMVVSGVWFFRVGLMFWIVVNRGPAGFDPKTFQGPFLTFLAFAQYLLPLAVLEVYLRVQERGGAGSRIALAVGLLLLTAVMAMGILAAGMIMWVPRM